MKNNRVIIYVERQIETQRAIIKELFGADEQLAFLAELLDNSLSDAIDDIKVIKDYLADDIEAELKRSGLTPLQKEKLSVIFKANLGTIHIDEFDNIEINGFTRRFCLLCNRLKNTTKHTTHKAFYCSECDWFHPLKSKTND